MKTKRVYRLPDGSVTTKPKEYVDAWRAIHEPFCEAIGAKIIGCDPDILIEYNGRPIDLPLTLVIKLNSLIDTAQ